MTLELFLELLFVFSLITAMLTEGIKKTFEGFKVKYSANIIALCAAIVVGGLGMLAYYVVQRIEINLFYIIIACLMALANWLVAMVGYDKVKQCIEQLKIIGG